MRQIITVITALIIGLSSFQPVPPAKASLTAYAGGQQHYQVLNHLVTSVNIFEFIVNDYNGCLEPTNNSFNENGRKINLISVIIGLAIFLTLRKCRLGTMACLIRRQIYFCNKYKPRAP